VDIVITPTSHFVRNPPRFCQKTCAKADAVPIFCAQAAQKRTNLQRKRRFGAENLAQVAALAAQRQCGEISPPKFQFVATKTEE